MASADDKHVLAGHRRAKSERQVRAEATGRYWPAFYYRYFIYRRRYWGYGARTSRDYSIAAIAVKGCWLQYRGLMGISGLTAARR